MRCLIIEDDSDLSETICAALVTHRHDPLAASSAPEGLDLLRLHPVELILLDINLPGGISGYAACEAFKSLRPVVPIVLMSGAYGSDADERVGQLLGAAAFLRDAGLTADRLVGGRPQDVLSGSVAHELLSRCREAIHFAEPIRYEARQDPSAESRVFEITATPILDARGICTHDLGSSRDISQRKHAEESLAQRTLQLEAVHTVSEEITKELDLSALLRLIVHRAMELVHAGSGTVDLRDDETRTLVPKAWVGIGAWVESVRLRLGEGIAGAVAERREGPIVNDFRNSPYAQGLFGERTPVTAVLSEPLLYQERLPGVITIGNENSLRPFTPGDQEMLAFFATRRRPPSKTPACTKPASGSSRSAGEPRRPCEPGHGSRRRFEPSARRSRASWTCARSSTSLPAAPWSWWAPPPACCACGTRRSRPWCRRAGSASTRGGGRSACASGKEWRAPRPSAARG
jgi:CheY-like chemotaxis protein